MIVTDVQRLYGARKSYLCRGCREPIHVGEIHVNHKRGFHWCLCCYQLYVPASFEREKERSAYLRIRQLLMKLKPAEQLYKKEQRRIKRGDYQKRYYKLHMAARKSYGKKYRERKEHTES